MPLKSRQMAWREKTAICFIIFIMNVMILFFIIGLGLILCPPTRDLSIADINSLNTDGPRAAVYMYGSVYFIHDILVKHNSDLLQQGLNQVAYWNSAVLGRDVSPMFDRSSSQRTWESFCSLPLSQIPQYRTYPDISQQSGWYLHQEIFANNNFLKKYRRPGGVIWDIDSLRAGIQDPVTQRRYLTAYDNVYDVSSLYDANLGRGSLQFGQFFQNISDEYSSQAGYDSTGLFERLRRRDANQYRRLRECMDNILLVGRVDHRKDPACVNSNWVLLGASCILVSVIGFKFLAALQFPGTKSPEDQDKFVICQVPCYTEVIYS
jgi:chitin synthase